MCQENKTSTSQDGAVYEYREIQITEATPKLLRPLLTYCQRNQWSLLYLEPFDRKSESLGSAFELLKEFPNRFCLSLQGIVEPTAVVANAFLLTVTSHGGIKQVYDADCFAKGIDHELVLSPGVTGAVPAVAMLSEYVAAKQPHETMSSELFDYLAEIFRYTENDHSNFAQAIYLALCVCDWPISLASNLTLDQAMAQIRGSLPEKLEHMGIGFYTARAAIETIATIIRVFGATPSQLRYIFYNLLRAHLNV